MGRKGAVPIGILLVLALSLQASAQLNVAETLLVDLRAEDLAYGSNVTTWPNRGTLGDFTARGKPVVEDVAGLKTVTFDGASWFDGPTSVPGIEGKGTRTIEVWAYNPTTVPEETMVHWSHRGGPAGTNMSFNYGNHTTWGAVGHWDVPDMGWGGSVAPTPQLGKWWHLVYTYDGTTCRLYANGSPAGSEGMTLNTHPGNIIRIAAQGNDSGTAPAAGLNFTGSIAEVRIHDGVLTQKQIDQNYKLGGPRRATNPFPADGQTDVAYAMFMWSSGTTAKWHNLYFGTSPDLGPADQIGSLLMYPMHPYSAPLKPGTLYYWRVDEVEADGVTVHTGNIWTFTAQTLIAFAPAPADGARFQDLDVDLAWQPGKDADTFDIYFGTSPQDVADGTGGTLKATQSTLSFEPGPLELGITYYWRVDLIDSGAVKHPGDVWSFTTLPNVAVSDPNLVGWWKFDEGGGTLVVDWSGRGQHGQIVGGAQWIQGYDGGALRLNGQNAYVELPIGALIGASDSITVATWVNFAGAGGAWQRVFDFGSGTQFSMLVTPANGADGGLRFVITVESYNNEQQLNMPGPLPTGWHHLAVAIDGSTHGMQMFLDGEVVATGSTTVLPKDLGETTQNWIGRSQYPSDAYFMGAVDDFRIYDFVVTAEQIPETMRGDPSVAWAPYPQHDSIVDIRDAVALSWSPGQAAVQHDVYFGVDEQAVASADTSASEYRGRQAAATFPLAGLVEFAGGDYFWRIDEIDADGTTVHAGRLWSFSIPDYLIVDEFESYTNYSPKRVFQTWNDGWGFSPDEFFPDGSNGNGTGGEVGYDPTLRDIMETSIVHGGQQSVRFKYRNADSPYYSDTDRTWPTNQDWTLNGVTDLSLWVYGYPVQQSVAVIESTGKINVTGAGADIWDNSDEFTFACKTLNGDGTMIARVVSNGAGTNTWAKGGVMIRESLNGGSTHAIMAITGGAGNGASFQRRLNTNGGSSSTDAVNAISPPYWVKIDRFGNAISGSISSDGVLWSVVDTVEIPMANPVYIGLAVTSHVAGTDRTYQFENVSATGTTGTWNGVIVDSPLYNTPAVTHITLQDSTGKSFTLTDPNTAKVSIPGWRQWTYPLSDFTGVNMTRIKKMVIGVGDKSPDGTGELFIDDIEVIKPEEQSVAH